MTMVYRREIDGLRAVAVVPVIFYHAGFEVFGGGFIGVDVFFVISGYLITSLIINELEDGRFSIVRFYERRARRILPALFFVMLCCIPFAWMWLLPSQLKDFSQSVIAVSLFFSNVLFWLKTGYFEPRAEERPLLHTWSLAVEEQYYMFFPLFLLLLWRFGRNRVFYSIVAISLISFLLSEWGWRTDKPDATFYLAPTRAWELMAGAICAFVQFKSVQKRDDILASVGLILIAFAVFAYDSTTPFPSVYALAPVGGTVLIILYGARETLVGRFLSLPPVVGMGLISYSAYLWHHPLFVFARIKTSFAPHPGLMLALAVLSVVLAYLTWKYVENPFRQRRPAIVTRKQIFATGLAMSASFFAIGLIGHLENGFDGRLTAPEKAILAWEHYDRAKYYREGTCFLMPDQSFADFKKSCDDPDDSDEDLYVIGDSHAAALSVGIRMERNVGQYTASGCPPIFGYSSRSRRQCKGINENLKALIRERQPEYIILHANWARSFAVRGAKSMLRDTIAKIAEMSPNSTVLIVGGVPQWFPSLPTLLLERKQYLDGPHSTPTDLEKLDIVETDRFLKSLARVAPNVKFVSLIDALCRHSSCTSTVRYDKHVDPIAWDYAHLTEAGSYYIYETVLEKHLR